MNLSSPFLSWQKAGAIALVVASLCIAIRFSPLHPFIEEKIIMPTNFQVRSKLGMGPGLDPRIKIFIMDDESYWYLGKHDFTYSEWAQAFKLFDIGKASVVIVDKVFDAIVPDAPEATEFIASLKKFKNTKIIAATWFDPHFSEFRSPLDLSRPEFKVPKSNTLALRSDLTAYGPEKSIQPAFHGLGHIWNPTVGKFYPFVRLQDDSAVPHISFFAGKKFEVEGSKITANGFEVPTDYSGQIQVNLDSVESYSKSMQVKTMRSLMQAMAGIGKDLIMPGDVTVILPAMYSGNFDNVESPVGKIAGGYLIASMINSVLTGKWLNYFPGELPLTILWCALGCLIAVRTRGGWFVGSLGLFCFSTLLTGLVGFSYFSWVMPWFYPLSGAFVTGFACFAVKSLRFEQQAQRLTSALRGVVSDAKLKQIIKRPWLLDLSPRQKDTTILFADVIGFSIIAERLSPEEVFSGLKKLMSSLSEIVHRHGGIVESTPGDGLLAYFGHDIDGTAQAEKHEQQAINCAIEIQRKSAVWILESKKDNSPAFPIRIGINTDSVFIGDLGGTLQVKPTVIGHAVNFAKRLESACDFFCIMVGQKTKKRICDLDSGNEAMFERRPILVKHRQELIEAYEIDPFKENNADKEAAIKIYRNYIGVWRQSDRFSIPEGLNINITFEYGSGRIVNFSERGIAVVLSQYIGKEVNMPIQIDTGDGKLGKELSRLGLVNIIAEVKWGRPFGDGYLHGLALKNLNKYQSDLFLECMNDTLSAFASAKSPKAS